VALVRLAPQFPWSYFARPTLMAQLSSKEVFQILHETPSPLLALITIPRSPM